jgi:hypothetical protein
VGLTRMKSAAPLLAKRSNFRSYERLTS